MSKQLIGICADQNTHCLLYSGYNTSDIVLDYVLFCADYIGLTLQTVTLC